MLARLENGEQYMSNSKKIGEKICAILYKIKRLLKSDKKRAFRLIFTCFLFVFNTSCSVMQAHLKGWYPTNLTMLYHALDTCNVQAQQQERQEKHEQTGELVRALIVPHAGLKYSGVLAARCFRLLLSKKISRVIILAPCHRSCFSGIMVPSFTSYEIAGKKLPVDKKIIKFLKNKRVFTTVKQAHINPFVVEHALEMELLFLAYYLPDVSIVPLFMGCLDDHDLAHAGQEIAACLDTNTVIIVSSDFTHYGPQFDWLPCRAPEAPAYVKNLDTQILAHIQAGVTACDFLDLVHKYDSTVCGKHAIALLLQIFQEKSCIKKWGKKLQGNLVGYSASYDKDGVYKNFVSYAGVAFTVMPV